MQRNPMLNFLGIMLLCGTLIPGNAFVEANNASAWMATGPMMTNRTNAMATLLSNGTVLVAGGCCGDSNNGLDLSSAEVYHPHTNRWTTTGNMIIGVSSPAATLLPTGKVLVVCDDIGTNQPLVTAQLYDPRTGRWAAARPMHTARADCSATLLPNGNVLVAGGQGSSGPLASAELYDPRTGRWRVTADMHTARENQTATLLRNGNVLVAGGTLHPSIFSFFNRPITAEIYNPRTGMWTPTHPMTAFRGHHTATLLPDGRVLVAGGGDNGFLSSAEVYDPRSNTWSATGAMHIARSGHTATLLRNGKVLVVGGADTRSAEMYDSRTGTWTVIGPMLHSHIENAATLLPSGKVLIVGGANPSGLPVGAEVYDPPAPLH